MQRGVLSTVTLTHEEVERVNNIIYNKIQYNRLDHCKVDQ